MLVRNCEKKECYISLQSVITHTPIYSLTFICIELVCFKASTMGSSTWQLHMLLAPSLRSVDKEVPHMLYGDTDNTSMTATTSTINALVPS